MSIKTKEQLEIENQASFPDNTTGLITPEVLRNFNSDIIDTLVDSNVTSSFATTGSNTFIGDQTIVGNVTFPSSSFISTNNVSGNLYFSALNGGMLHLNDDGGEGDVIVGYVGSAGKLKVRVNSELTGSQSILSGSIAIRNNGNVSSLSDTELSIEANQAPAAEFIVSFNQTASAAVISYDGATYDNELWTIADSAGIRMTDWNNGTGNLSTIPVLSISANDGSQPPPQLNRGLGVTGSIDVLSGSESGSVITNVGNTFTPPAVTKIISLTAAEYSGITPDTNTLYIII